jgi:hypothetical protein
MHEQDARCECKIEMKPKPHGAPAKLGLATNYTKNLVATPQNRGLFTPTISPLNCLFVYVEGLHLHGFGSRGFIVFWNINVFK